MKNVYVGDFIMKASSVLAALTLIACSSVAVDKVYAGPSSWGDAEKYAPIQQRQFCDLTNRHVDDLAEATASRNEIKVNMTKKKRQLDLDGLLPEGAFNDWIVKVVSVKQVVAPKDSSVDGDAAIVLELWCGTQIGTGQLKVPDGKDVWGATINYDSREYREVSKLSSGDFAVVSGKFMGLTDFYAGFKETYYASRPLTSDDLKAKSTAKYSNGSELFLAKVKYIAAAN
jgi:hypothetical protein